MTNTKPLSKTATNRAHSKGRGLAPTINAPLSFATRKQIEAEFHRIDTLAQSDAEALEMRRAALNFMVERTNDGNGFDQFYAGVNFIRDSEWYWRDAGFTNFEDFWSENGGKAFGEFAELEKIYNFAKTSCPDLFNLSVDDAKNAARAFNEQAAYLSSVPAAKRQGERGNGIKALNAKVFDTKSDAKDRLLIAADYKPVSAGSMERRFARLRRDAPEVAADMLRGKYITKQKAGGVWVIDFKTAEELVYGKEYSKSRAVKKSQVVNPENAAKYVRRTIAKSNIDAVIAALNSIPGLKVTKTKVVGN